MSGSISRQDLNIAHCWWGNRINDSQSPALVGEGISPVNDVRRFLDGALRRVVLDIREGPFGKTDLRRWFVPKFQPHDFGARRDEPTFHGWFYFFVLRRDNRSANLRPSVSPVQYDQRRSIKGKRWSTPSGRLLRWCTSSESWREWRWPASWAGVRGRRSQ